LGGGVCFSRKGETIKAMRVACCRGCLLHTRAKSYPEVNEPKTFQTLHRRLVRCCPFQPLLLDRNAHGLSLVLVYRYQVFGSPKSLAQDSRSAMEKRACRSQPCTVKAGNMPNRFHCRIKEACHRHLQEGAGFRISIGDRNGGASKIPDE
jgi:hypothetical protein